MPPVNPSRRPSNKPPRDSQAQRTNILLGSLQGTIQTVAEKVTDLQQKMEVVTGQLAMLTEDVAVIKPLVYKNTKDIEEIKECIGRIEAHLSFFGQRLTAVEAKLPS